MSPVSRATFYKNNSNSRSKWMIGMAKIRRKKPKFRQNPKHFHSCINFKLLFMDMKKNILIQYSFYCDFCFSFSPDIIP